MVNFTKQVFSSLAVFVALLTPHFSQGQEYYTNTNSGSLDEKNFRLGLSINPNLGWLRYDDDHDANAKIGFSYGLVADLGFAKNYFFSTGLLINSISSGAESNTQTSEFTKRDINLKYVEVPLTIKLKSEENDMGRFYGQFGFTAGVKVSGKEKLDNNNNRNTSIDGADLFRLGLQLGGGLEWKLDDNLSLMTGLSFNNGFTRAIKEGRPKTSFTALNIGIFF